MLVAILTAALVGTIVLAVFATIAAYQNGVIDGARNQWLPHVKRILERSLH